jgi:hypothetical protein
MNEIVLTSFVTTELEIEDSKLVVVLKSKPTPKSKLNPKCVRNLVKTASPQKSGMSFMAVVVDCVVS